MKKLGIRIVLFMLMFLVRNGAEAQSDSILFLSFQNYMKRIVHYHPLAVQAGLQEAWGDAQVLKAKGAFDPKLQTDVSQKYFDDQQYYSLIDGALKIPTWFGVEFKTGYEVNDGLYLNDQNKTPGSGLLYAGIQVPIGQGLIIDKRRAELKKARIYQEGTQLQRLLLLNDLLFEAGTVYWQWQRAYRELQILKDAVQLASDRFSAVRQTALLGDRPFIDTIEAGIQVQNRELQYQQAKLYYSNATLLLSVYLWSEDNVPLELNESIVPPYETSTSGIPVDSSYVTLVDTLVARHPELDLYNNKIEQLTVQKKWNQEQLKPELDLKYNPIVEPVGTNPLAAYSVNNYTWGLTFSMPVLLRKERAELKMTQIQIQETQLDRQNKQAELMYKARAALNEWGTAYNQVLLYRQTVQDSKTLLEGEQTLFNVGESSLFMVNARELSYIQTQLKLAELVMKNRVAVLKTDYALGMLVQAD